MRTKFLLVFVMSLLFLGCGYGFTVNKRLPFNIEKIFVEMFKNNTEETGLEVLFTNHLIKQLVDHLPEGIVKKVNADAILCGEMISLDIKNLSNETSCFNPMRLIVLETEVILKNPAGKTLWCSGRIRNTQSYAFVSNSVNVTETNKAKAITKLSKELSATVFLMLTERF